MFIFTDNQKPINCGLSGNQVQPGQKVVFLEFMGADGEPDSVVIDYDKYVEATKTRPEGIRTIVADDKFESIRTIVGGENCARATVMRACLDFEETVAA